jgi:cell division protein FtsA
LKVNYGTCDLRTVSLNEQYTVPDEPGGRRIDRLELARIIEARMRELLEMVSGVVAAAGPEATSAGVVLTGGGAQLQGIDVLAREILRAPVRVAAPEGPVMGLLDDFRGPQQAAILGLFSWVAKGMGEMGVVEEPSAGAGGRIAAAAKGVLARFRR